MDWDLRLCLFGLVWFRRSWCYEFLVELQLKNLLSFRLHVSVQDLKLFVFPHTYQVLDFSKITWIFFEISNLFVLCWSSNASNKGLTKLFSWWCTHVYLEFIPVSLTDSSSKMSSVEQPLGLDQFPGLSTIDGFSRCSSSACRPRGEDMGMGNCFIEGRSWSSSNNCQ